MQFRTIFATFLISIFSLALIGCGGGGNQQPTTEEQPTPSPEETGVLQYAAKFEGDPPERREIDASANPECGKETILGEEVVVNDNQTLRDVVIAVQQGPSGYEVPADERLIDQENCIYRPHLTTVKAGQTVTITDSDEGMHNVRATQDGSQLFNMTTFQGDEKEVEFDKEGVVKLDCDIHPWMEAWVYVTDHGQAAVTGEDGKATLNQLPEGDYQFKAWHEEFGAKQHKESITAEEEISIEDVF